MQCTSCGTELDHRDAFWSQCGQLTARGQGAGRLFGSVARLGTSGISKVTDPANRKVTVRVGAGLALFLTAFTDNPVSNGLANLFSKHRIPLNSLLTGSQTFQSMRTCS